MNKIQIGLAGLILGFSGLISGCGTLNLGGDTYRAVDLRNSHYASDIQKRAGELALSENPRDKGEAVKGYGATGNLELMDKTIREMIFQERKMDNIFRIVELGEEYNRMYEK